MLGGGGAIGELADSETGLGIVVVDDIGAGDAEGLGDWTGYKESEEKIESEILDWGLGSGSRSD